MNKITPFLWFDTQAEEAMNHYLSIFKNSRVIDVVRQGEDGPVVTVTFELEGQRFVGLNAGPNFKFNEAVSFFVDCEAQEEVDELWAKLTAGGEEGPCGWLKDKFGLSWQIIPRTLSELLRDKDPEKAQRVTEAMFKMKKIDIAALKEAYEGTQHSVTTHS
jgi:predicted 3-demethylubiquinone-9 3-methyltransferase (glyoxalase superfamily)